MKRTAGLRYLILNSAGELLSHALLESPPAAPVWQLRLLDDDAPFLEGARVHMVGMEDSSPSRSGQVLGQRRDILSVEPAAALGDDMRRNLRIPVRFESYLYPLSGDWTGRRPIVSLDLSGGGLAFYCAQALEPGELLEAVVPVTSQPLVLRAQVLRPLREGPEGTLYASKFVDLTCEEEALVREAVFGIQLETRRHESADANTSERNDLTCV